MSFRMRVLVTASLSAALVAPLAAQSFNADVGKWLGEPSASYGAAAAQAGHWNNVDAGSSSIPLSDLNGNATAVIASHPFWSSQNTFDAPGTGGDDERLMDDFSEHPGSEIWTVSGLSNGTYEVFVYAWSSYFPVDVTQVTVIGGAAGPQNCGGAVWPGGFVPGTTHVKDTVQVSGGSLAFELRGLSPASANLNGFQLRFLGCPVAVAYCSAGTTSSGCVPAIGTGGTPSLSNSAPFTLTVSAMEGSRSGIFFYSIGGRRSQPWGNSTSTLCLRAPTQRMNPPAGSGGTSGQCDGSLAIDWNAYVAANPGRAINRALAVGSLVGAQAWSRDPSAGTGPVGAKGTSLSAALEFSVCP